MKTRRKQANKRNESQDNKKKETQKMRNNMQQWENCSGLREYISNEGRRGEENEDYVRITGKEEEEMEEEIKRIVRWKGKWTKRKKRSGRW